MLAERGLKVTPSRVALLSALRWAEHPLSHSDLTARDPSLDRATVYRNLEKLVSAGLVVRALFADRVARYALARGSARRSPAHFVCMRCGHVQCLDPEAVQLGLTAVPGAVDAIQLTGTCVQCLEPSPPVPPPGTHE
jgi:Fur family ferric uptake transcriptional regulator